MDVYKYDEYVFYARMRVCNSVNCEFMKRVRPLTWVCVCVSCYLWAVTVLHVHYYCVVHYPFVIVSCSSCRDGENEL